MRILLFMMMILNIVSCSVKSEGEAEKQKKLVGALSASNDSDGDMVNDKEESELGRNPFVADIPDVRVRFLQNYTVIVQYLDLLISD